MGWRNPCSFKTFMLLVGWKSMCVKRLQESTKFFCSRIRCWYCSLNVHFCDWSEVAHGGEASLCFHGGSGYHVFFVISKVFFDVTDGRLSHNHCSCRIKSSWRWSCASSESSYGTVIWKWESRFFFSVSLKALSYTSSNQRWVPLKLIFTYFIHLST